VSVPPFQRVGELSGLPAHLRGCVVAIGNFDGVHRGHQAVLETAVEIAARDGRPAVALTFEPHPRALFQPDRPLARITPPAMKARLIGLAGLDAVVEQAFTPQFAERTAEEFLDEVLIGRLDASHVVTGFDFHFGRGRAGNPAYLVEAGRDRGFGVTQVGKFCDEGGEGVSSSRIRGLLGDGNVGEAAGLLGYRFTAEAEIVHGRKLGRTLGYPTANMVLPEPAVLGHGIYAVRLRRPDGSLHDGVASFGRRPTIESDGVPLLETFVFDFSGDLYREVCRVSVFGFLRGEEKFESLEALNAQMRQDEAEARALLSGVRPLSDLDARLTF
jgi:riboflavin kinase/FMN adenylyltransferase